MSRHRRVEIQVPELIKVSQFIYIDYFKSVKNIDLLDMWFESIWSNLKIKIFWDIYKFVYQLYAIACAVWYISNDFQTSIMVDKQWFSNIHFWLDNAKSTRRVRRQFSTAASICTAKTSTVWNGTRWSAPIFDNQLHPLWKPLNACF